MSRGLDGNFDSEALKIDDSGKDSNGGKEVHDVWEMGSVECFPQGSGLIWPGYQEMEKCDNCAFELFASASIDGGRRECAPDDGLANSGSDEEGNSRAQSVALLQQLIKKNDDQTSYHKLNNQEKADASTEVGRLTVQPSEHKDTGLAKGEDDCEELLRSLIQFSVGFEVEVNIDEVCACQELRRSGFML